MEPLMAIVLIGAWSWMQVGAHGSLDVKKRGIPSDSAGSVHAITKRGDNRVTVTASLTHPLENLPSGSIIPFNNMTSNLMAGYNATSGVYTCPISGNYFFSAAVTSMPGGMIQAEIVLDGMPFAAMHAEAGSTFSRSQASNSGVTHCSVGQTVYVRVVNGNGIHGDLNSPITSFSGFLIWDD